jgi:hypothetical protein
MSVDYDSITVRQIADVGDLDAIYSFRGALMGHPPVVLRLPGFDQEELEKWQVSLNRHLSACGCAEGALLLSISLGAYIAFLLLHHPTIAGTGWHKLVVGFAIGMVAAVAGKSLGLFRARWMVQRTIRLLKAYMDAHRYVVEDRIQSPPSQL